MRPSLELQLVLLCGTASAAAAAVNSGAGSVAPPPFRRIPVVPFPPPSLAANETANDLIALDGVKTLAFTRLDPIVDPNATGSHMHYIVGGSSFAPDMTYDTARDCSCTTIPVTKDLSNYWSGPLYYIWENGSLSALGGVTNISYLLRPPTKENTKVQEFPASFQMLGGSATRRAREGTPMDNWIWYECVPSDGSATQASWEIPDQECTTITTVVNFPWCWDGTNLTSGVVNSHVAYPSGTGADWVNCDDPNYPHRLPRIQYNVKFDLTIYPYRADSLVLSNGDRTGYRWPVGYLVDVFDTRAACRAQIASGAAGGNSSACSIGLANVNRNAAADCTQSLSKAMVVDEGVGLGSTLNKLPGCNGNPQAGDLTPGCNSSEYLDETQPRFGAAAGYFGPDSIPISGVEYSNDTGGGGTNTGAIVGGVVGGVVGLALVATALVFCLRRRKRKQDSLTSESGGLQAGAQPDMSSRTPVAYSERSYSDSTSPPPPSVSMPLVSTALGSSRAPSAGLALSSATSRETSPGMPAVQSYTSPSSPTARTVAAGGSLPSVAPLSPYGPGPTQSLWGSNGQHPATGTFTTADGRQVRDVATVAGRL